MLIPLIWQQSNVLHENHNYEKPQYTDQTAQKIANYCNSVKKKKKSKNLKKIGNNSGVICSLLLNVRSSDARISLQWPALDIL